MFIGKIDPTDSYQGWYYSEKQSVLQRNKPMRFRLFLTISAVKGLPEQLLLFSAAVKDSGANILQAVFYPEKEFEMKRKPMDRRDNEPLVLC